MTRIGIFGGTFSPPHLGHVHAARLFLEKESLDRLLIIPTNIPPHKQMKGDATPEERLEMCRLAFSFDERISVSDMEIRRGGLSYTADTLRSLHGEDRTLVFLCGTDMLLTLDLWREPETIFSLAEIVCIQRENDENIKYKIRQKINEYEKRFAARVRLIEGDAVPLSATECRLAVLEEASVHTLVPPEVEEYIKQCKLYRS